MTEGYIYFISDGAAIKIGFSGAPSARLSALQTSHHLPLRLIGVFPGTADEEQHIQKRFLALWIRGEWFRREPALLNFIREQTTVASENAAKAAQEKQLDNDRHHLIAKLRAWARAKSPEVRSRCELIVGDLKRLKTQSDLATRCAAMQRVYELEEFRNGRLT